MAKWKTTIQVAPAQSSTAGHMTPIRVNRNVNHFDETNETSYDVLIDCQHIAAILQGKQANSQFGHGMYSVDVYLHPKEGMLESWGIGAPSEFNTEVAIGLIKCKYVTPNKARYAALHHLKTLERRNNLTASNVDNFDGESHPLLVSDIDSDDPMSPGSGTGQTMSGHKGAKVIRFSYDDTVSVYGQDQFIVDLNQDGDVDDDNEYKMYNLVVDNDENFGILPRYEASVNPVWNESGDTTVNLEWDKPLSSYKAYTVGNSQIQRFGWQFHPTLYNDGGPIARFNNIEALGGLIKLEIDEFVSTGNSGSALDPSNATDNNDFVMFCTVTCHSWTPMKK